MPIWGATSPRWLLLLREAGLLTAWVQKEKTKTTDPEAATASASYGCRQILPRGLEPVGFALFAYYCAVDGNRILETDPESLGHFLAWAESSKADSPPSPPPVSVPKAPCMRVW